MVGLKQGSTLKGAKYKIIKTLGQGSFGITYLATTRISMDGQLGKMEVNVNITIKEFFMSDLNSRAKDGTSVERTSSTLVNNYLSKFQREAENLSKLHHPNIVKVLEVFDENNTTYYVMEFIDGETIDEFIKRKGKLSVEESLAITKEVCKALSYMHDHKMLHLDLKPKNIMRDSEGHIYLIDFGLAKQYNENGKPESSTTLGLGTPGYAPIEQAHYKKDGTFPVTLDIYALGASLYKMLTGKTPPDSSYVLNDGLSLDVLNQAGVDEKIIAVVEKAMAPIKKDRYQTVATLLDAISNMASSDDERTVLEDVEEGTIIDKDVVNKTKVTIYPDTDQIVFYFNGSSVPPPYHRSYKTHITEQSISLRITCYDDLLYEEKFPFNRSRYDNLLKVICGLNINRIPERSSVATGGETLALALRRGDEEYYSGYIYGREFETFEGTTDADLYIIKKEIEKCIPNFQVLITKEKEDEPEEYECEEEQSFFEKYWKYGLAAAVILLCVYFCSNWNSPSSASLYDEVVDTLALDSVSADSAVEEIVEVTNKPAKKDAKDEKKLKEEVQSRQKETNPPVLQNSVQSQNTSSSQSQSSVVSFNAEAKPEPVKTDAVYDVVEEMPSFLGGASGVMAYLSQSIKYPVVAKENGVQGRVIVIFVVERDGSITDVKVAKSVDPSLDKEAVRVIKGMPKWRPGKQNGAAVRVKYTIPVTFRLQ